MDPRVLLGARRAIERQGWSDATLERIAEESGLSRMTLHRRGVSRADLLAELGRYLEDEHRQAVWPALTAPGTGRERLMRALTADCELAERNLELLGALGESARASLFHEDAPQPLSRVSYVAPLERLLADGAADGSLRALPHPPETATVLFNLVGLTYRHLRQGHGWPPDRARRAILELAMNAVRA